MIRENSTAKPLSRWRTTRPGALPTRTTDPIEGRLRLTTATPETDRSTMAHCSRARDHLIAIGRALVAAVFGHVEGVPVGEPGQLLRKLVALALSGSDGHREAARQNLGDQSLKPPDMIEIGDYAFALAAACGGDQGNAARRHVNHLAGEFAVILKHVATEQIDLYPLVS